MQCPMKSHDRLIRRDISGDKRTTTMGVVMSEELQYGTVEVTARVEHDVIVIPVQHVRAGHVAQS